MRIDFIDKFFIALGWDVNHDEQKNPYEQEVKVERKVTVSAAQKRADYAFFLSLTTVTQNFMLKQKNISGITVPQSFALQVSVFCFHPPLLERGDYRGVFMNPPQSLPST